MSINITIYTPQAPAGVPVSNYLRIQEPNLRILVYKII